MELAVWLQMLRIPGLNAMSSGSNGTSRGGESPCGYSPSFSVSSRAHGELGSHMGTEIQKQMIGVLLLPKVAVRYLTNYLPKSRNVHLSPKNSERIVFTDKPSTFQSENSALQAHQQMSLNKGTLTSSSSALQNCSLESLALTRFYFQYRNYYLQLEQKKCCPFTCITECSD